MLPHHYMYPKVTPVKQAAAPVPPTAAPVARPR
jgi:hypothetical protein